MRVFLDCSQICPEVVAAKRLMAVQLTFAWATDVVSSVKVSNDKHFSEEKTLAKADAGNQFKPSSGWGSIAQW
jgi:hypothetical protein